MVVVVNHKNDYGKNDNNNERKIQDAYLNVKSTLFCEYCWH
jgi:hypothetical protein